jgi:hypothetical protein
MGIIYIAGKEFNDAIHKKKIPGLPNILFHNNKGFPFLKSNAYYYLQFIEKIYFFSFLWKSKKCVLFLKTQGTRTFSCFGPI